MKRMNIKYFVLFRSALGQTELSRVHVTGIRETYDKYRNMSEAKGVRAHFQLDESSLLILDRVT